MFTTARSLSNLNVPRLKTRKALIVINLQKDTFYQDDDAFNCKNSEFVEEVKNLIPCFRDIGDVVWVQTEIAWPAGSSPRTPSIEDDTAESPRKDRQTHKDSDQCLDGDRDESQTEENESRPRPAKPVKWKGTQAYHLLSHVKSMEMRASAQASVKQRPISRRVLNDNTNVWEKQLAKSTRGQEPKFYIAGTSGAELLDDLKDLVDKERDMTVIKQFYSAFDQTSLLMSLRMRLVTEIYICGSFTNIGVYATAVDAVQHGFEVNIVEDCVGYRSADKHDEAMRQMADVLGVNGTDSEEIIAELGGRAPPDTAEPMFASRDLGSIKLEESSSDTAQSKVAQAHGATNRKNAETSKRHPSRHPKANESLEITATETSGRGIEDIASDVDTTNLAAGRRVFDQSGERSPFPGPTASKLIGRKSLPTSSSILKGPGDNIGTGDSRIIHNVLTSPCCEEAFDMVRNEVDWQVMHHRGGEVPRLVAVQGQVENDGTVPLYRHPADESPPLLQFSPAVDSLRKEVERTVKQPLNHALIQLYRDGNDNISEHSDKTLDIVRGSNIINLSLGAQRVMTLRTKKPKRTHDAADAEDHRQTQRIPLPHNSAFVLGPQTNAHWLHGLRADKRLEQHKGVEEKSYRGERISITFRHIGTFMNERQRCIWGQGAKGKTKATAGTIPSGDVAQMEAMIVAFGRENQRPEFDWDAEYGQGFNVVNLVEDTHR